MYWIELVYLIWILLAYGKDFEVYSNPYDMYANHLIGNLMATIKFYANNHDIIE